MTPPRESPQATYRISVVAERYGIHPQTLRMYEREGLLRPFRSRGNTRFYTDDDLHQLELILHLTRELEINLAGVEVVLNMRQTIVALQRDLERALGLLASQRASEALIPVSRPGSLQRMARHSRSGGENGPIDSTGS